MLSVWPFSHLKHYGLRPIGKSVPLRFVFQPSACFSRNFRMREPSKTPPAGAVVGKIAITRNRRVTRGSWKPHQGLVCNMHYCRLGYVLRMQPAKRKKMRVYFGMELFQTYDYNPFKFVRISSVVEENQHTKRRTEDMKYIFPHNTFFIYTGDTHKKGNMHHMVSWESG